MRALIKSLPIASILFIFSLIEGCILQQEDVVVVTANGTLVGKTNEGVNTFFDVPYAKPPIGKLRWQRPQSHPGWSGQRTAYFKRKACIQTGTPSFVLGRQDEDCLYLNIWAPAGEGPHPVMVWVHGGAFVTGAGGEPAYDGATLAKTQDIIVVSFNYRLGYLGYMAMPQFEGTETHNVSGNQGSLDQVAVLQWVQDNISNFGGDSNNVTVFGQSAGSLSTCTLLASPLTDKLFNKAIMHSGFCGKPYEGFDQITVQAEVVKFLKAINCTPDNLADGQSPLDCARQLSPEEIQAKLGGKFDFSNIGTRYSPMPTLDNYFLPGNAEELLGQLNTKTDSVSLMLGITKDDASAQVGALPLPDFPATDEEYSDVLNLAVASILYSANKSEMVGIDQQYPQSDFESSGEAALRALNDGGFICPARRIADIWSQSRDVYFYHFTQTPSYVGLSMKLAELSFSDNAVGLGVHHYADLPYVFGVDSLFGAVISSAQQLTRKTIMNYWGNFARSGNPNAIGLPKWPKYTSDQPGYLELNQDFQQGTALRQSYCDYWNAAIL